MQTIKLWRGDAEKIRRFDYNKTNKGCYVGQGVYLTDSLRVAKSYMTKGTDKANKFTLFKGLAKDRAEAFEKALDAYTEDWARDNHLSMKLRDKVFFAKKREALREHLAQAKEDGRLVINYCKGYRESFLEALFTPEQVHGYLAEFEFPAKDFETSVFHVEKRIQDSFFWELVWDQKVPGFGLSATTREEFVRINSTISDYHSYRAESFRLHPWTALRRVLQPYGYRGFEYLGGRLIGSQGLHRAFCLWDDEFVNDHKVKSFKPTNARY